MRTTTLPVLAFTLLSALLGVRAHGEEFIFNFYSISFRGGSPPGPTLQGSGVFTGTWLSGNEWQITGVQGTMDGKPLTLVTSTPENTPDNLFYTGLGSGGYGYGFPFDLSGVGVSNGAVSVDFACGSISYSQPDCEMLAPYPYDTSGLSFTYTQVPEPATFALLSVGLALLALRSLRRRDSLIGHTTGAVAGA